MPVEPPPPFGPTGDTIAGGGPFSAATGGGGSTPNYPSVGTGTPDVYAGPPAPSVVNSVHDTRDRVTQNAVPAGTVLPIILGRGRVEGRVIHVIEGNPEILIVAFAAGPNNAFEAHYLNGQVVTSGSDGVTITEHLGAYNQAVDSTVSTYIGNYRLPGLTYAVYSIDGGDSFSQPSPFFGQVSSIVADLKGIELYDPRENRIIQSEDFSSTRWTCSGTFPTRVTGITDRFNNAGATRWTFGASGPYTIYRDTSGLSLATSDPVTVAIDVRSSTPFTCNLTAKKTSGSSTSTSISVKTSWRRYTVTHPAGTGTGNARIQLDGIPSSSVIEVRFASVQIQAEDFGHTITTASAITVGTRWAENPFLGLLFLETDEVNGAGGTPTSKVNMASWGKAAALCDGVQADGTATYSIGLVLSTEGDASRYREAIRGTCAGEIFWEDGLLCAFVDSYQPNDPVLQFSTKSDVKSPLIPAKGPRFGLLPAPSRPTHVVVQFHDAAKGYSASSAQADHPLLKAGTVKYQEAVYSYDAIVSERVADRVARYTEGRARLCEVVGSLTVPFVGIRLTRGMLIEVTTEDGLSAQQVLVDDFEALDSGEYVITACHEYDTALYTFSALTPDTPPSTTLFDPRDAPPGVTAITTDDGGFGAYSTKVLWRRARSYKAAVQYGAGFWTLGDVTGGDTSKVNDGNTSVTAFTWGTTGTPRAVFDAGVGNTKKFGKVRIHQGTISAVNPQVAYSDDAAAWTTVAPSTTLSSKKQDDFTLTDFVTDGSTYVEMDWIDVGAHRYWRVFTSATGAFAVQEIQFTEIDQVYPDALVAGYEVRSAGPGATGGLLAFFPGAAPPTDANAIDISVTASTVGDITRDQTQTTTVEAYVFVRNILGLVSTGRHIKRVISVSATPGASGSLLRSSAVGAVTGPYVDSNVQQDSSGHIGVGVTPGAHLHVVAPGASDVAGIFDTAASPTADILQLKKAGTTRAKTDKEGSLRTLESSRVAPWVETRVVCTTNTTVNINAFTYITGATVTFTPPSDCRVLLVATWDLTTVTPGQAFVGEIRVNGTPEAAQAVYSPVNADRACISQVFSIALTGGTSYTILMTGNLAVAGANYTVNATHTGFAFAAVGRF